MRMSVRPSVRLSEVRLTHEWFNMSKYALHHTTISQGLISQSRTSPLKLVLLRCECSPQNTVFGNIWFIVIFSEIALKRERERYPQSKAKTWLKARDDLETVMIGLFIRATPGSEMSVVYSSHSAVLDLLCYWGGPQAGTRAHFQRSRAFVYQHDPHYQLGLGRI